MCFPSANSATREAEQAEADRAARIAQTTQQVNALYDSPERAAQRAQYGAALRDFYVSDADRQKGIADRDLRFALARSGLTGGSFNVDANRQLGEEYTRGILDAERRTQAGMADLLSRDEQSRLNLTGLAQSGLNTTTAAQQAAAALRANTEGALAAAKSQGLGDIFAGVNRYKTYSEEQAERRRADSRYTQEYPGAAKAFGGGY